MPIKAHIFSRGLVTVLLVMVLAACSNIGDRRAAMPTALMTGSGAADVKTLVVVLPGRRDNVEVMRRYGVPEAIHAGWPEVDVQLTSATMAYYKDGGLARRVREEILEPARVNGYQRIIVMGASLGGMGSLIVDQGNPNRIDHIVLMAPYLGDDKLLADIQAAGGIEAWDAGPKPASIDSSNFQRELWRHIQSFTKDSTSRSRVWLAYGEADPLAKTMPVIAPALDAEQFYERDGGHKWVVWNKAATEIFTKLRHQALASVQ